MVMISEDKKLRILKLNVYEIDRLIDAVEGQPYNIFKYFNYKSILKKLKDDKNSKRK